MVKSVRPTPQVTLDMRGSACPGPLLGAKRVLDELMAGEVLLLISDCPGTKDDLLSWPKYTDVTVLKSGKADQGGTEYFIQKGKARRISANAELDMRGAICPGPIVEAKKLLNSMREGDVVRLVSDCPGIRADVRSWVKATGLELANARESAPGEFVFHIRKR